MKVHLQHLAALATALQPFMAPQLVGVPQLLGALIGAGLLTDAQIDDHLRETIALALTAKAEADRAVRGEDPQS